MESFDYYGIQGDVYHQERHREIFNNVKLLKNWGEYADHIYFSNVKDDSRVLEVGAGTGINLSTLKNRADVTIVEPSDFARKHCYSIGLSGFKDLSLIPKGITFECVFVRHVLEHLRSPIKMLEALKMFMNENSILIVIVPVESGCKKTRKDDLDHHLYCWNPQTLNNLMIESGYHVLSSKVNSYNGRRLFSFIRKYFGKQSYYSAINILGKLRKKSEIIIEAKISMNEKN